MSSTGDLAYFTIPVANLERGKDFYGGLFGWKFEAEHSHEKYAHIGNTTPAGGLNVADGASARVWFKVGNIRTSVARVRELGGQADEPLQSASGWSCACRDDQGTQFDLWEPAPGF